MSAWNTLRRSMPASPPTPCFVGSSISASAGAPVAVKYRADRSGPARRRIYRSSRRRTQSFGNTRGGTTPGMAIPGTSPACLPLLQPGMPRLNPPWVRTRNAAACLRSYTAILRAAFCACPLMPAPSPRAPAWPLFSAVSTSRRKAGSSSRR